MTVMACDKCDSIFVTIEESTLTPCPRCYCNTRWATRDEVSDRLRGPRRQTDGDELYIPMPGVLHNLNVASVVVCRAAKEVCEMSRQTREQSRKIREARQSERNEERAP